MAITADVAVGNIVRGGRRGRAQHLARAGLTLMVVKRRNPVNGAFRSRRCGDATASLAMTDGNR